MHDTQTHKHTHMYAHTHTHISHTHTESHKHTHTHREGGTGEMQEDCGETEKALRRLGKLPGTFPFHVNAFEVSLQSYVLLFVR